MRTVVSSEAVAMMRGSIGDVIMSLISYVTHEFRRDVSLGWVMGVCVPCRGQPRPARREEKRISTTHAASHTHRQYVETYVEQLSRDDIVHLDFGVLAGNAKNGFPRFLFQRPGASIVPCFSLGKLVMGHQHHQ